MLENMRAGVMDRLGLSYEVIRERNPKIVYAALRGFGDPQDRREPLRRLARLRHRGPGDGRLRPHQRPRGRRRVRRRLPRRRLRRRSVPRRADGARRRRRGPSRAPHRQGPVHGRRDGRRRELPVRIGVRELRRREEQPARAARQAPSQPEPLRHLRREGRRRGDRGAPAGPVEDPLPGDGPPRPGVGRAHEGLRGAPQEPGVRRRRRLGLDRLAHPRPGRRNARRQGALRPGTDRGRHLRQPPHCRPRDGRRGRAARRQRTGQDRRQPDQVHRDEDRRAEPRTPARRAPRRDPRPVRNQRRDQRRAGPGRPTQGAGTPCD